MSANKRHWRCMADARGHARPGCARRIEAGPSDFKALRAAGWRQVPTGNMRAFFECPACALWRRVAKHAGLPLKR